MTGFALLFYRFGLDARAREKLGPDRVRDIRKSCLVMASIPVVVILLTVISGLDYLTNYEALISGFLVAVCGIACFLYMGLKYGWSLYPLR